MKFDVVQRKFPDSVGFDTYWCICTTNTL